MKNAFVALALLFTVSSAHANSSCGMLTSVEQAPSCEAGQMCAEFVRMVPTLIVGRQKISIEGANSAMSKQILDSEGQSVCVTGEQGADGVMQVESLTPEAALK